MVSTMKIHRLRSLRLEQQLSIIDLAHRALCHPSEISRIEHHRLVPYPPLAIRLAEALGTSAAELFGDTFQGGRS